MKSLNLGQHDICPLHCRYQLIFTLVFLTTPKVLNWKVPQSLYWWDVCLSISIQVWGDATRQTFPVTAKSSSSPLLTTPQHHRIWKPIIQLSCLVPFQLHEDNYKREPWVLGYSCYRYVVPFFMRRQDRGGWLSQVRWGSHGSHIPVPSQAWKWVTGVMMAFLEQQHRLVVVVRYYMWRTSGLWVRRVTYISELLQVEVWQSALDQLICSLKYNSNHQGPHKNWPQKKLDSTF